MNDALLMEDGDLLRYSDIKKEAAQLINAQGPDATPESGSVVASAKSVSQGYSGVKCSVSGTQETRGPADIVDNLPKEATV